MPERILLGKGKVRFFYLGFSAQSKRTPLKINRLQKATKTMEANMKSKEIKE